jgi:hypothetical protein
MELDNNRNKKSFSEKCRKKMTFRKNGSKKWFFIVQNDFSADRYKMTLMHLLSSNLQVGLP